MYRKTTITCANCGSAINMPPSKAKRATLHFCCRACSTQYRKGKSASDFSQPARVTTLPCTVCGTPVTRKLSHLRESGNIFCSTTCMGISQRGRVKDSTTKISTHCSHCDIPMMKFPSRMSAFAKHYCSSACRSAAAVKADIHIERTCKNCGIIYSTTTHQVRTRGSNYCSKSCMDGGMRTKTTPYSHYWRSITRRVRERDSHTCQLCGVIQLSPRLDVHHIIRAGDFAIEDVESANDMSNLVSLCRSCHRRVESGAALPVARR